MSLKRHTIYNVVGGTVPALVALVTIPIYLPVIGADRFGALSLVWLIAGSFGFFDLGLTRSTAFRIASEKTSDAAARGRTVGTALAVGGVASLVAALVAWAALHIYFLMFFETTGGLRKEIIASLPMGGLLVATTLLGSICNGALQGRERFLEANVLMTLGSTGVQAAPLLAALMLGTHFSNLVAAMLAVRLAALGYGLVAVMQHIAHPRTFKADRHEGRLLSQFGKWVMGTSLLAPLILYLDRLLLGASSGGTVVASYNAPFQLAQRLTLIPTSIGSALFPRTVGEPPESVAGQWRSALSHTVAIVTPPVVVAIFGMEWFIDLWVGDSLPEQTAQIGELLLVAFWFNGIGVLYASALESQGRPHVLPILLAIELPLYFLAVFLAARFGGPLWVAAAFGTRCAVDAGSLMFLSRLNGQVSRDLLAQALLVIVAIVAVRWLPDGGPARGAVVVSLTLVSACVALVTLRFTILGLLRSLPWARS